MVQFSSSFIRGRALEYRLGLTLNDKIFDVANLAVRSLDMMTTDIVRAAQMEVPPFLTLNGFSPLFW